MPVPAYNLFSLLAGNNIQTQGMDGYVTVTGCYCIR